MITVQCDFCKSPMTVNSRYHCIGYGHGVASLITGDMKCLFVACDACWQKMSNAVDPKEYSWKVKKTDRGGTTYICPNCKAPNIAKGSKYCPNCGIRVAKVVGIKK